MDGEYKAAIQEFYKVYRSLQKKYNLQMHSHFRIHDEGVIEIWVYDGRIRKRCICKVKEEDETLCYQKAMQDLERYGDIRKENEYGEKVG